jgi:hypothetical protein
MFIEKNIDGKTYSYWSDQLTFAETTLLNAQFPHLKLISHKRWPSINATTLAIVGPIWTCTRITCALQAVWFVARDYNGMVRSFDKNFMAWAVFE